MDRYSRIVLTIIMFLLLAILLKPKIINEAKGGEIIDVNIVQVAHRYIQKIPVSID